jgi:DNA-directed RNA polymerase
MPRERSPASWFISFPRTLPKQYVISRVLGFLLVLTSASQVLNCIGDIFSGARAIQDWLTVSAKLISRSIPTERVPMSLEPLVSSGPSPRQKLSASGKPLTRLTKELMTSVVWTSPLGLPVVQPYRKPVRKQVSCVEAIFYDQSLNLAPIGYDLASNSIHRRPERCGGSSTGQASDCHAAQLYSQSRCHPYAADSHAMQGR